MCNANFDYVFFDWSGTLALKSPKSDKDEKLAKRLRFMLNKLATFSHVTNAPSFEELQAKLAESKRELQAQRGDGLYTWSDLMRNLWPKVGLDHLQESEKEALLAAFFSADESPMYPGTVELLSELHKKGVPLGLIRNSKTPAEAMRKRLAKYGINDYFKVVVMAGEEGVQKPDPEVFLTAVREANIQDLHASNPSRILYVGNETELDVKGSNGVGWASVLVKHTESSSNGLARFEIANLLELLDIILKKN